jgi:RNA polymerase sigma-70 factor (ECF subfamily)
VIADEGPSTVSSLRHLPIARDDAALVEGMRAGEAWASALFFDRYAPHVHRILRRILGHDDNMEDVVHDCFVQALGSLGQLRDAVALLGWIQSIAANTAFKCIRARRARRWLRFWEPSELPEPSVEDVDPELVEAYRRTYALLSRMPAEERIAFALRYVDGMELTQVAEICGVSLATIKRRLVRAEARFAAAAGRDEVLREWLEKGGRWTR